MRWTHCLDSHRRINNSSNRHCLFNCHTAQGHVLMLYITAGYGGPDDWDNYLITSINHYSHLMYFMMDHIVYHWVSRLVDDGIITLVLLLFKFNVLDDALYITG